MNVLVLLGIISVVIYSCVSWLLPTVLAWLFKRKFHIKLKIGRIAVPKLVLKDVTLTKDGYSVCIKELSFKSSFFNSDINKLVSVIIQDLQFSNNVEERKNVVVETILKPLLSKQNSTSKVDDEDGGFADALSRDLNKLTQKKLLDFRDKKLPPSLIMFAQFMGLHIYNVSVTLYSGTAGSAWSLQAGASELHADGAADLVTSPTRALVFSARVVGARARLAARGAQQSLADASCMLLLEGTVRAEGPLNVEKIHAAIANPYVQFQDDLYDFVEKQKRYRRPVIKSPAALGDHSDSVIPRLSPVIPKIFSLKIETTLVNCVDINNKTHFKFSVQSLVANSRFSATSVTPEGEEGPPQVYVAFQGDRLRLAGGAGGTLLYLDKLKLDAKLEKGVLNLYLILSMLNVTYDHDEVFRWYTTAVSTMKTRPMEIKDCTNKAPTPLERLLSWCVVQGCAELRAARVTARAHGRVLAAGCGGLKLKLEQLIDTREESYTWRFPRLLLANRHWSTELLVDGGWAGAGAQGAEGAEGLEPPQRRHHAWGSALLAVALFKWGSHGPKDSKVEAMMDCLRFEWSTEIAATVIAFIDSINEYRTQGKESIDAPSEVTSAINVNVALSHINVFLIVSDKMCLMVRVDAVSIENNPSKFGALVSGMKAVDMVPYKGPVTCHRADEIQTNFFHVKLARIEHVPLHDTASQLDIQFIEIVDVEWSVNLHLKILTFVRAFNGFREQLKERKRGEDRGTKKATDWTISFKNETNVNLVLSAENNLTLATDDTTISYSHTSGLCVAWGCVRGILNGDELCWVAGLSVARGGGGLVRGERAASEGFQQEENRVWDINIASFRLIFPHRHRFAEAIQGDLITLVKWLKLTHGIEKKPFTAASPLPSDLFIKIEEVLIEMTDDPFEVKLRDNYELLEDEYKESQKRRTMLDAKVQELCKPHLFLPAGKVEELYAALREKDAQIYVRRCRAAPGPRSRLVACCFTRLRILALADPSLHGTTNATNMLRQIDHDSPWPEEGVEFSTLWCRGISVQCLLWQLLLRDFPQPLLSLAELRLWGTLLAAEEKAPSRALRVVSVDQGSPWGPVELERSMMPLKWYPDVCCEVAEMSYAFGPCWEPVIAQCNLAFDQVSRPSLDPSPPLPWWDKIRLLLHGRLTANFRRLTCLLHVSLDPYNTTEEMEVTWADLVLDWTNGKIGFLGSLCVFARTASKYDDCRVLRVPQLRLSARLAWRSAAPRDHRAAAPTAPARRPDYSSNQEHDSYRAFRSHGLDLHLSMETKPIEGDGPVVLLYGSTLRWFESLKLILSGVTRPTRRGRVFGAVRPRKPQLSRHYRAVHATLTLHDLQVFYWSSSSMQRGVEMLAGRVTCGSKHTLALVPCNDGLVRRPRAVWTTVYLNCDLNDAEVWLKAAANDDKDKDNVSNSSMLHPTTIEKYYCVSVGRVWYGREAGAGAGAGAAAGAAAGAGAADPAHRLTVHNLRGAWTKQNRDLAFALFDTYIKTQQLKKNLSTKALKEEENPPTPNHQRESDVVSPPPSTSAQGLGPAAGASAGGARMLAALVAEGGSGAGGEPVVLSDELGGEPPPLHATRPTVDEAARAAWIIELINSQVVLKGCETRGYVILCAARAEVKKRVKAQSHYQSLTSWSGQLSAMQYYATVTGDRDQLDENIQWVCVEEIEGSWAGALAALPAKPRLVVGAVVGCTVGPSAAAAPPQLQRIVSRCACEFYYLSTEGSGEGGGEAGGGGGWPDDLQPLDCFTLVHHDLDVCTNSLQYAMVLDVVNNVVLHVEPARRRALERRARMRFQLQLLPHHDPRRLLHQLQTQVRESLARLRRLEKEYYMKNRSLNKNDPAAIEDLKNLDNQVNECKETVWSLGDELDALVVAWRERPPRAPAAPARPRAAPHRHNEICFKSARWRLTDADGQLGIADLLLTNFLYTKTSRSDDSVEHQLELGYVQVTNLLPNEPFPEVLVPQAPSGRAPLARRAALRVFCRDRPPVGGISVKEHFEVNIVPIKIGLTKKFFNTMLKFCFPERDPDAIDGDAEDDDGAARPGTSSGGLVSTGSKKAKKKGKDSNSNFYVKRDKKDKDDVEKMKERAEKNKLFIYIKIPEVPVRVSYKGSKEKNLEDVRDLPLVLPTLEYHNVSWTWLDLLLATKSDTRRVILSQAIRQKLQLHRRAAAPPEPLEEDKARLLLGGRTVAENKPHKKSTPSVFKFSKS